MNNSENNYKKKNEITRPTTQFKVNEYLELRLEGKDSIIYVNGERFDQCKFLLLDIPIDEFKSLDEIESIDEAAEKLNYSLEPLHYERIDGIPPEVEFWGHCSNLQVWAENNYDTRLIHSNLAFPLLLRLNYAEDQVAKRVFKEEIVKRFLSGHPSVMQYLFEDDYLNFLSDDEYENMFDELEARGIKGNFVTHGKRVIGFMNHKRLGLGRHNLEVNHGILGIYITDITKIKRLNNLTELEHLNIAGHRITEIKGFNNFKNLKKLILSGNGITEIKGLDKLSNLEELWLNGNKITKIKGLDALVNLKKLYLTANKITKIEGLDNLINLEELELNKDQISEITGLNNLINLKSISLYDNKITEIKGLDDLKNLEDLTLTENIIDEIKGLENLKNLKSIGLPYNKIPKELIQRMGTDGKKYVKYCQEKLKKNLINKS